MSLEDEFEMGRKLGDAYVQAAGILGARMAGMLQGIQDRANQAEAARRARLRVVEDEAERMADEVLGGPTPEKDPSEVEKPWGRYPMSATVDGVVDAVEKDGRIVRAVLLPYGKGQDFVLGMPVTIYGPTPEESEDIVPPVKVRAAITTVEGKTTVFVPKDQVPPGSLVEVRLLKGPAQ